ncbi:MAG: hypothetical protein ACE5JC_10635 [Candidatus Zixiibacteriota bacterium]
MQVTIRVGNFDRIGLVSANVYFSETYTLVSDFCYEYDRLFIVKNLLKVSSKLGSVEFGERT